MSRPHHLAWSAGGIILVKAMLHLISGVTDNTFPTPFAMRSDKRPSASMANLPWSMVGLLLTWFLLGRVSDVERIPAVDACVFGLSVVLAAPWFAWGFNRCHEGSAPPELSGTP